MGGRRRRKPTRRNRNTVCNSNSAGDWQLLRCARERRQADRKPTSTRCRGSSTAAPAAAADTSSIGAAAAHSRAARRSAKASFKSHRRVITSSFASNRPQRRRQRRGYLTRVSLSRTDIVCTYSAAAARQQHRKRERATLRLEGAARRLKFSARRVRQKSGVGSAKSEQKRTCRRKRESLRISKRAAELR